MKTFQFTRTKWTNEAEGTWVSFLVPSHKAAIDILSVIKEGVKYICEVKQHRERRSLDANAYFHVLVHKISETMGLGDEETKVNLVLEYGSVMRDENGDKVGFKLPSSVAVNSIYKYAKWFDKRVENGKEFDCYIIYEHTHKLDSKQMARLIDGAVYEAQELGIETRSPAEIERMKALWERSKNG